MNWLGKVRQFWTGHQSELLMATIGLALIGGGVFWWKSQGVEETKVEILGASSSAGWTDKELLVDVSGAVKNPGVYHLKVEARVVDAVEMAGGVTENADKDWIDKYLNRSAKVSDGQKIYIPTRQGENDQITPLRQGFAGQAKTINVNEASRAELEVLSGVGPVTAGKIISGRPYGKIEELIEKKLVSQKVYDQIKDQISVW